MPIEIQYDNNIVKQAYKKSNIPKFRISKQTTATVDTNSNRHYSSNMPIKAHHGQNFKLKTNE